MLVVAGFGIGLAIAPVNDAALADAHEDGHGTVSSLVVVARMTGMVVGLALLTSLGLRRFHEEVGRIPDPTDTDALLDAAVVQVQTVLTGAGLATVVAAVLALDAEKVEEVCGSCEGVVVAANYNCEGQIVISGEKDAVEAACVKMKEAGAKRALPLPVGGAFHSPLMEPARAELAEGIEKAAFTAPRCPVYQNVTALPSSDPKVIKENLLAQLTAPVRWTQSVKNMAADGASEFIEVGPGKVLQGLIAKIL